MFDWMRNAVHTLAQIDPPGGAGTTASQPVAADNATTPVVTPPAPVAEPPAGSGTTSLQATSGLASNAPEGVQAAADTGAGVLEMGSQSGVLDFIQQSDWVGQGLFIILLLMSLASWYLILYKSISNWRTKRRTEKFLRVFWAASSLEQVENEIVLHGAREPFSHVTGHAIHARNHHATYGAMKLEEAGSTGDFVTRTIRKCIDEETSRLENGLTVLASVGSTAPFVGLFGTVWGVYHALIGIGLAEGVTVNRIAGPVGEALIMTGLGLAVAIPAVVAYNFFVRSNRVYLGKLDAFAHDLFTFLTTGQQQFRGQKGRREPTPEKGR